MSWITIVWSIAAGVSLTLSAVHALAWMRQRAALEHLFFSVSATAGAALAILELALMHSQTPAEYGVILRWMHVPAAAIVISTVWFIRLHLRAGRSWLAWLITGLRMAILILNFSLLPNASFQEIHALREMTILGETLSSPTGIGTSARASAIQRRPSTSARAPASAARASPALPPCCEVRYPTRRHARSATPSS